MKILLIDDSGTVLGMMKALLEQLGHSVATSSDGPGGLDQLASFDPDVVVCDLRMPGMDGLAVLREIRNRSAVLPVIIFTEAGDVPHAVAAMKEGAFSYLVKGSEVEELIRELDRASAHRVRLERNIALERERAARREDA